MSKHQRTKDENYMIALYEMCTERNDFDAIFNKYTIGERAGVKPKAVDAICTLLIRANFVKKSTEDDIYLTAHGRKLVETQLIL